MAVKAPLDKVSLQISSPYFYRKVRVMTENKADKAKPLQICTGLIFRFPAFGAQEARTTLDCPAPIVGPLTIVIENGDNPPLAVEKVTLKWISRTAMFVPLKAGGALAFYSGHPKAVKPSYDLNSFISQANWHQVPFKPLTLGETVTNTGFQAPPPDDSGDRARNERLILITVIIVLVAGIGFWLVTLYKKARASS